MSTGVSWEDLRQVCATLLGARHVPHRLCLLRVRYNAICLTFALYLASTC